MGTSIGPVGSSTSQEGFPAELVNTDPLQEIVNSILFESENDLTDCSNSRQYGNETNILDQFEMSKFDQGISLLDMDQPIYHLEVNPTNNQSANQQENTNQQYSPNSEFCMFSIDKVEEILTKYYLFNNGWEVIYFTFFLLLNIRNWLSSPYPLEYHVKELIKYCYHRERNEVEEIESKLSNLDFNQYELASFL